MVIAVLFITISTAPILLLLWVLHLFFCFCAVLGTHIFFMRPCLLWLPIYSHPQPPTISHPRILPAQLSLAMPREFHSSQSAYPKTTCFSQQTAFFFSISSNALSSPICLKLCKKYLQNFFCLCEERKMKPLKKEKKWINASKKHSSTMKWKLDTYLWVSVLAGFMLVTSLCFICTPVQCLLITKTKTVGQD